MPRRVPLPPELREPFRVADALALGVGAGRLRGHDLARPHHGVRAPATTGPDDVEQACRAYLPLLGRHHFSHLTAARLWGCPLPQPFDRTEALHVTAVQPNRAPRGRGVIGHHARTAAPVLRHGMPTADPIQTWLSLAPLLTLDDLVACGDHLVLDPVVLDPHDPRPFVTLVELREASRVFRGRGASRASAAARLIRAGAESRPESLLRLLLQRAGLPEPELNVDLHDARGRWIARVDLVYREWNTVVEYDGDGHRTSRAQYERDMTRIDDLTHAGCTVVRVRSRGLFTTPDDTVDRVTRSLRARGWTG